MEIGEAYMTVLHSNKVDCIVTCIGNFTVFYVHALHLVDLGGPVRRGWMSLKGEGVMRWSGITQWY